MRQLGNELSLEEYLFGREGPLFEDVRLPHSGHLSRLIQNLESQGSVPVSEPNADLLPLLGHPKRLLTLDQILAVKENQLTIEDIINESVDDQQEKLTYASGDAACPIIRQLAHSLLKRFWRFHRREDLDGAIWYGELGQSLAQRNTYYDLESLLGLCSALYDRCQLLGLDKDYQRLLLYLKAQRSLDAKSLLKPALVKLQGLAVSSVRLIILTSQK